MWSAARSISVFVDTLMIRSRIEFGDRAHERLGQFIRRCSHVAERAVKAHVRDAMSRRFRDARKRAHLIHHVIREFKRIRLNLPPAEAHQVGKADVRADIDLARQCHPYRLVHDDRVARVIAARHIGGRDDLEHRFVFAHSVGTEAFAQVRVQVDFHNPLSIL